MKEAVDFNYYNIDKLKYKEYFEECKKEFENKYDTMSSFEIYQNFTSEESDKLNKLIDYTFSSTCNSLETINRYYKEYETKSFLSRNSKDETISDNNLKTIARLQVHFKILYNKIEIFEEKFKDLYTKLLALRNIIINKLKEENNLSPDLKCAFLKRLNVSVITIEMNINKLEILKKIIKDRINGLDIFKDNLNIDIEMKKIKKSINEALKFNVSLNNKNTKLLTGTNVPMLSGDVEKKEEKSLCLDEKKRLKYLYYYLREVFNIMKIYNLLYQLHCHDGSSMGNDSLEEYLDGNEFNEQFFYISNFKISLNNGIIYSKEEINDLYRNPENSVMQSLSKFDYDINKLFNCRIEEIKELILKIENNNISDINGLFNKIDRYYKFLKGMPESSHIIFINNKEYEDLCSKFEKIHNEYCSVKIESFDSMSIIPYVNYFTYELEGTTIDINPMFRHDSLHNIRAISRIVVTLPKALTSISEDIFESNPYIKWIFEEGETRKRRNPWDFKSKISTIILPNVKEILDYPFSKYPGLRRVIAPELEVIYGENFQNIKSKKALEYYKNFSKRKK